MRRRTIMVAVPAAFLVVAGLVGAACSGSTTRPTSIGAGAPRAPELAPGPDAGVAGQAVPIPGTARETTGGTGLDIGLPTIGPKIIKQATLALDVKKGSFDQQFQQATLIAGRHGGFVADSQMSTGRRRSGSLVIRVPADQFEATLGELKGLGKTSSQGVSGSDVTAQFVDLQARLRNWETQESVLLKLLAKSKSIDDSIKVQRALQDVQLAIEEIRGQLRVLSDQTDFSTISVSMTEAGLVVEPPKKQPSLVRAWHKALDGFLAVIAAVVVGVGYLAPIVLMGAAIFVGGWGYRRYRRRTAKPLPTT